MGAQITDDRLGGGKRRKKIMLTLSSCGFLERSTWDRNPEEQIIHRRWSHVQRQYGYKFHRFGLEPRGAHGDPELDVQRMNTIGRHQGRPRVDKV